MCTTSFIHVYYAPAYIYYTFLFTSIYVYTFISIQFVYCILKTQVLVLSSVYAVPCLLSAVYL